MDVCLNINKYEEDYCIPFPYWYSKDFKELDLLFADKFNNISYIENSIYRHVRELLINMGFDKANLGTPYWNPLSDIISRGDKVVIKPNLVLHHNANSTDIDAVVTNAVVIRPLIDYCLLALKGDGTLIIADAPHGDADFDKIVSSNGLKQLVCWYNSLGFKIELRDLRKFYYPKGFSSSVMTEKEGDPDGYTEINLKEKSYLIGLSNLYKLYGSDYNRSFIVRQHQNGNHRYKISNTILSADVIISVPKLKTHKKTGVTINLKNLVGINGDKNYLAHYRVGSPAYGGDEYPSTNNILILAQRVLTHFSNNYLLANNSHLGRMLFNLFIRPIEMLISFTYRKMKKCRFIVAGNWYGNDTCWRMCLDLNYILRFCDKNGTLKQTIQRKYFCLVDGIVAGEGEGPMTPTPRKAGILVAGINPYLTDYVCAYIMGYDCDKLNTICKAFEGHDLKCETYQNMKVMCMNKGVNVDFRSINLKFIPQAGWKGYIER